MKILITGATGFVGGYLIKELVKNDHSVKVLTRNAKKYAESTEKNVQYFSWNPETEIAPKEAFIAADGSKDVDVVINLMGENISNRRWSTAQKKKIFNSRVLGTNNLVEAINTYLSSPLDLFISTSAVGIYEANTPEILNEDGISGKGFLANVCQEWEASALNIKQSKRTLILVLVLSLVITERTSKTSSYFQTRRAVLSATENNHVMDSREGSGQYL